MTETRLWTVRDPVRVRRGSKAEGVNVIRAGQASSELTRRHEHGGDPLCARRNGDGLRGLARVRFTALGLRAEGLGLRVRVRVRVKGYR